MHAGGVAEHPYYDDKYTLEVGTWWWWWGGRYSGGGVGIVGGGGG